MFQYPMQRIGITAGFDYYTVNGVKSMHYGIDISRTQPETYDVLAANDGRVILSLYDSAGGNMIVIQNDNTGELSRYAHLASRAVSVGVVVSRGQKIGVQGNTGTATTAQHLHFETWLIPKGGYKYNYSDREKYAVDPICVCRLMPGQLFPYVDAQSHNYAAIPYPEPQPKALKAVDDILTIQNAAVRVRSIPETVKHSPIIGGKARKLATLGDFTSSRSFQVSHTCIADEKDWALANTERGWLWIAVMAGYTTLSVKDAPSSSVEPPVTQPDNRDKQIAVLKEKIAILETNDNIAKTAFGDIRNIVDAMI